MKHKTSELTGALLDAAVALAEKFGPLEGVKVYSGRCWIAELNEHDQYVQDLPYEPSTDWRVGGPILERERIATAWLVEANDQGELSHDWCAYMMPGIHWHIDVNYASADGRGPTPLIAAMRAFVTSKLGDEVELP